MTQNSTSNDISHEAALSNRMLILYFVFTIAITWVLWAPTLLGVPEQYHMPFIVLGAFGPLMAAIIIIRVSSRPGGVRAWLKGILNPEGAMRLIIVGSILLPAGVGAAHFGLYRVLGGASDFSEAWPWYAYPIALILTALFTGGNEELGWRGFALPVLVGRYHPVVATVVLGLVHSIWHLPLMARYDTTFVVYFINLLGLTFILNWLYFVSRRCVIPVMLFHASTNVIGEFIPTPEDVLDGAGTFMVLRGIVYWALAILLITTTKGRLGYRQNEGEK